MQSYPSQLRATVVFSLSLRSSLGSTLAFCLLFLLLLDYIIGPLSALLRLFYTCITHSQIKGSALEEGNVLLRKSSRCTRYRTHSFQVNSETVSALPEQLKYICCVGCIKSHVTATERNRTLTEVIERTHQMLLERSCLALSRNHLVFAHLNGTRHSKRRMTENVLTVLFSDIHR